MPLFYSHVTYQGDGSTRLFNVPFPFIKREYVIATVDEVEVPFEWLTQTSISFLEAPAPNAKILIYRDTAKDKALVSFNDGAVLTGSALEKEFTQLLHIAQETWDVPSSIRELADDLEVKMIEDTEQAHQAIDAKVTDATGVISTKVTEAETTIQEKVDSAQATIQETSDTATGTIATAVSTAQTTIQEKVDGALVTIDDKVLTAETTIQAKADTSESAIQAKVDTAVATITTKATDAEAEIQAKVDTATGTINDLVSANEATIGGYATAATEAAATATEIASGATAYVESTRQSAEAAALSATNAAASAQNAWLAEKNRVATTTYTGVVQVGAGLTVDGDGLLEVAESVRTGIVTDLTAMIDAETQARTQAIQTVTQAVTQAQSTADAAMSKAGTALETPGAIVVSPPTLTFPSTVAAGYQSPLSMTAGSIRICPVSHFLVSVDGGTATQVVATDNAASCQVSVRDAVGETCIVKVIAVDALGNESPVATVTANIAQSHIVRPSVTSPAAGTNIIWNANGLTMSSSAFSDELGIDTHKSTDWKVTSDAEGNTVIVQALDSTDKTQHSFSVQSLGSLTNGSTLYLWVRHQGNILQASQWSEPVAVTAITAYVQTPSMTAPASGSQVVVPAGILATSSAFAVQHSTDTHVASDWRIVSAASGGSVIKEDANSSDLTSHTFTGLSLTSGTTYYIQTRHKGQTFGWSAWSATVPFVAMNGVLAPSGRLYYYDSATRCVVGMYKEDGVSHTLRIPCAEKRVTKAWGSYGTDTSLTNFTCGGDYLLGNSSKANQTNAKTITDAQLDTWFAGRNHKDRNTAKQNTDVIAALPDAPAAKYCRSIIINGRGCDLPNIQQVARIYCDAEIIDSLDPTVGSYSSFKLVGWNMSGTAVVWSSTEYNSNIAWSVNLNGSVLYYTKSTVYGVVPVQEI